MISTFPHSRIIHTEQLFVLMLPEALLATHLGTFQHSLLRLPKYACFGLPNLPSYHCLSPWRFSPGLGRCQTSNLNARPHWYHHPALDIPNHQRQARRCKKLARLSPAVARLPTNSYHSLVIVPSESRSPAEWDWTLGLAVPLLDAIHASDWKNFR